MTEHDGVVATSPEKKPELRLPSSVDPAIAEQLVERARTEGVDLVGPGGLLGDLTKQVLETGRERISGNIGRSSVCPAAVPGVRGRSILFPARLGAPTGRVGDHGSGTAANGSLRVPRTRRSRSECARPEPWPVANSRAGTSAS